MKNPLLFEIIGEIEVIETIAIGGRIRDIMRIQKQYGPGRWRKLKGFANVKLQSGNIRKAELQLVRSSRHRQKENENQKVFRLELCKKIKKIINLRFV